MAAMVLGVFTNRSDAEEAIRDLQKNGYSTDDISIIMKDKQDTGKMSEPVEGAVSGATTGGVLGGLAGLLIGIGAITIPGIGAILIGGPIAAALGLGGAAAITFSGALTGALAGGLVGGLVGMGIPEDEARIYEDRIREGAVLIAVPSKDNSTQAKQILEDHGADQVRSVGAAA